MGSHSYNNQIQFNENTPDRVTQSPHIAGFQNIPAFSRNLLVWIGPG